MAIRAPGRGSLARQWSRPPHDIGDRIKRNHAPYGPRYAVPGVLGCPPARAVGACVKGRVLTAIAPHNVPFLPRGVRLHWCDVRQGWYLLAPERAVKMDQVAAAILEAVDGQRTFESVVEKLAIDFKAPRERIALDAAKFLGDLVNRRMVEVRP